MKSMSPAWPKIEQLWNMFTSIHLLRNMFTNFETCLQVSTCVIKQLPNFDRWFVGMTFGECSTWKRDKKFLYRRKLLFDIFKILSQTLKNLIFLKKKSFFFFFTDFHVWLITYASDQNPYEFFLYRRWQKKAEFLFTTRPELQGKKLNRMIGFDFLARDNIRIQAYLSLPPDVRTFRWNIIENSFMLNFWIFK